jgi:NADH-quinone oxidoreductase E subunit
MSEPAKELQFSAAASERIEWLRSRYPADYQRALILPVLSMAQREFGWIGREAVRLVAKTIPVPVTWVEEVATFYTMYNTQPTGRWHLQVCHNLSCAMMGAEIVIDHIENKLGIHKGETTEDGQFTLMGAECLGSCGSAPMMQVNDHYYENLNLADVDGLIDRLRSEDDVQPAAADLLCGPGSGPSRKLPADARPLDKGWGVVIPGHGDGHSSEKVEAERPVAGEVDGPDFEPRGMAR